MDALWFLALAALVLFVGYRLAFWRMRCERDRLAELHQLVVGEMEAMHQVHRIYDAFTQARDELRRSRTVRVSPADRDRRAG